MLPRVDHSCDAVSTIAAARRFQNSVSPLLVRKELFADRRSKLRDVFAFRDAFQIVVFEEIDHCMQCFERRDSQCVKRRRLRCVRVFPVVLLQLDLLLALFDFVFEIVAVVRPDQIVAVADRQDEDICDIDAIVCSD